MQPLCDERPWPHCSLPCFFHATWFKDASGDFKAKISQEDIFREERREPRSLHTRTQKQYHHNQLTIYFQQECMIKQLKYGQIQVAAKGPLPPQPATALSHPCRVFKLHIFHAVAAISDSLLKGHLELLFQNKNFLLNLFSTILWQVLLLGKSLSFMHAARFKNE